MSYDALVDWLKTDAAKGSADGGMAVRGAIDEAVETGRLPPDIGQMFLRILSETGGTVPAGIVTAPAEENAAFEDRTVPHAFEPAAGWPGGRSDMADQMEPRGLPPSPPLPSGPDTALPKFDELKARVDDVVLSGLIGDFKAMRRSKGEAEDEGGRRSDGLDGLLESYRSARFRSDAKRAARDGPSESMKLGNLTDYGAPRVGVGALLRDRFILDAEIGRGGMGIVYAAVDRRRLEAGSGEPYVALKLLNDEFRHNGQALRVLEAEARKAQSLAHPNIATVYDFDRDRSEIFIVMELLSGKPLSRHLAAATGQSVSAGMIAHVLKGVCGALAYAHQKGVVHSDLKPGNIFVTDDNTVKLIDFGLATASAAGAFDVQALQGLTAAYASPEMFIGATRDPRDDIFALGCIAYQLLTGFHPFAMKPSSDAMAQGLVPDPVPGLDDAAWQAILRSVSFSRETRTPTVGQFFEALFED